MKGSAVPPCESPALSSLPLGSEGRLNGLAGPATQMAKYTA